MFERLKMGDVVYRPGHLDVRRSTPADKDGTVARGTCS